MDNESHATFLEISPTGKYIVSSGNEYIKIWDFNRRTLVHAITDVTEEISDVKFYSDEKYLIISTLNGKIQIWNFKEMGLVHVLKNEESEKEGTSVIYKSKDDTVLAVGTGEGKIQIWNLVERTYDKTFAGHVGAIKALTMTSDNNTLISGDGNGIIKVWNIGNKKLIKTLAGHKALIDSVSVTRDDNYLISSSHDRSIRIWDLKTKKVKLIIEGKYNLNQKAVASNDGQFITAVTSFEIINCFQLPNVKKTFSKRENHQVRDGIALNDNKYLITHDKNDILIYDLLSKQLVFNLRDHKKSVYNFVISKDEMYLFSSSEDATIKLWDLEKRSLIHTFEGHEKTVLSMTLSSDEKYLASGSSDKSIKIWDLKTKKLIYTFMGNEKGIYSLYFSYDDKILRSKEYYTDTVKYWSLETYSEITNSSEIESLFPMELELYPLAESVLVPIMSGRKTTLDHLILSLYFKKFLRNYLDSPVWVPVGDGFLAYDPNDVSQVESLEKIEAFYNSLP